MIEEQEMRERSWLEEAEEKKQKTYRVFVTRHEYGYIDVEAPSKEEAEKRAMDYDYEDYEWNDCEYEYDCEEE